MLLSELNSMPWRPEEGAEHPPTLCEECGEVVEDGEGWYSQDQERVLCTPCKRGEKW